MVNELSIGTLCLSGNLYSTQQINKAPLLWFLFYTTLKIFGSENFKETSFSSQN